MKRLTIIALAIMAVTTVFAAIPVGSLHRDTIQGVPCRVYLPSTYEKRVADNGSLYPCLYLQHGMFGCEDDWVNHGNLIPMMDSLLKEEVVAEMVIIMPDNFLGSIPPAERAALMARPNIKPNGEPFEVVDGQCHWRKITAEQERAYEQSGYWEEHFDDFIDEVERRYYVKARSKERAVAGLSMGGFHSFHLNHYWAGVFDYVGLFSPTLLPRAYSSLRDRKLNGFVEQLTYSSPAYSDWMDEMRGQATLPPVFWIGMGREDFLYGELQEFRKWLDANGYEYTYFESTGGHCWANWREYLQRFLKVCFMREY